MNKSKELKEQAIIRNHKSPNESLYYFNEEEMQAFIDQLCKEHRKKSIIQTL